MIKIIADSAIPYIRDRFPKEVKIVYYPATEITSSTVKDADVLIVRTRTKCDRSLLEGSGVKLVATATIGTDHIDSTWCEENGIAVRNASGCNAPGVAQYVFASLFKTGFDPRNHTLGIIGYGNVGHIVGEWSKQMGIRTLVCDPPRKETGYHDADYSDLNHVLQNSDAITLHVPLNKEGKYPTFKMIGEKELQMMKPGATLVNSSRGGVVDETALKIYIKERNLKAIIDVWENEPKIDREMANLAVIATPHIAGYSVEGKKRATRMVLKEIESLLNIKTNAEGLECEADGNKEISRTLIEESYNPFVDSKNLLKEISKFEELRNNYPYRHEPLFT